MRIEGTTKRCGCGSRGRGDVCLPGSDEIEPSDHLVMVFDDEQKGFEKLLAALLKSVPAAFESVSVSFEAQKATLDSWREKSSQGGDQGSTSFHTYGRWKSGTT